MMRSAQWKPRTKESIPLKWARLLSRAPLTGWLLSASMAALFTLPAVFSNRPRQVWETAGILIIGLSGGTWLLVTSGTFRPSLSLRRLIKTKGKRDISVAGLVVRKRYQALGSDEGIVFYEDGALVFEGLYTNFRLFRDDVLWLTDGQAIVDAINDVGSIESIGDIADKHARAFFLASDPNYLIIFSPYQYKPQSDLKKALFDWLTRQDQATGESVLPPLDQQEGFDPMTVVF